MYIYPLAVIAAGLLSISYGGLVNKIETYDICSGSRHNNVRITAASNPFIIRSHGVGIDNYDNNLDCSLVLQSGKQPLVLSFKFRDFQVEYQRYCGYDFLCMGGATFCGDWLTGYRLQFILPENSDFTISFRTDSSKDYRGFKIEVSQALATSQIVHQPRSGIVSSSGTLTNTEVAYGLWYAYTYSDRCARPSFKSPEPTYFTTTASTTALLTHKDTCYSAEQVRELNEVLDQAIAGLQEAKRLLNKGK